MTLRGIAVLKIVGTISLGLLTGMSYSLSTLSIPTLLTLPSASAAARALETLTARAKTQLRALDVLSSSALLLAFVLSPRPYRHPYLLYTPVLILGARLAMSDLAAPYLAASSSSSLSAPAAAVPGSRRKTARARMEASYEVLGGGSDAHSEDTSGGSLSGGEEHDDDDDNHHHGGVAGTGAGAGTTASDVNGEVVRAQVEHVAKQHMVQSVVAGLGFAMAVVGIWGDGAA